MDRAFSVVILAAGAGTRMKSKLPKVLHPLCGRSLLGHAVAAAEAIEPAQVIAVVRHQRDLVAAEATRMSSRVVVADQDEIPGTGRAVYCALKAADHAGIDLGDTILVTSGDVPLLEAQTLQDLLDLHRGASAAVTLVTTNAPDPAGYGRIIREGDRVARIVEQKDASPSELAVTEINAGIYAFDAGFLRGALAGLGSNNAQGEVYLTDTVALADAEGLPAVPFVLEDRWQAEGCNDLEQLSALRAELTGRVISRHQRAGVSVVDPRTTSIDVQVILEADSRVEPGCQLLGDTRVAEGAVVGPLTTLENVVVGSGATAPHCLVRNARIEAGERVQPFTARQGNATAG